MSPQEQSPILGLAVLAIIIALLIFRRKVGRLRTAALLVTLGTVGLLEHPGWSIINVFQIPGMADHGLQFHDHSRIHFFMAAIYSLLTLVLILFIAWTGLVNGRRSAWYAILGVLIVGGGIELLAERFIYMHGNPIYALFGVPIRGFGWLFLNMFLITWPLALAVSFRPIFGHSNEKPD